MERRLASAVQSPHDDAHTSQGALPRDRRLYLYVASGWLLLAAYFTLRQLVPPTPNSEFSYAPMDPSFHIFGAMRGFTFEQLLGHGLRTALLAPALWLLSLGLARAIRLPARAPSALRYVHVVAGGASLLVTTYLIFFVLRGRPIINDEISYASMARAFAQGRLAEESLVGMTLDWFEVSTRAGVTGKYLFGESIVQIPGILLGYPALSHVVINGITLAALYFSVQQTWSDRFLSACCTALLAVSPMFMFCAATAQSETTSLSCAALAVLGYTTVAKQGDGKGGLLAGLAVAFGTSVRPQSMVPIGTVIGAAFLIHSARTRRFGALASFTALVASGLAAIAAYNTALSGKPWILPWYLTRDLEHYGFGKVWSSGNFIHTPLGSIQNLLVVLVRLNSWWLGWPLAILIPFQSKPIRRVWNAAPIFLGISAALVAFQIGYYSTGVSDVGPIYHFELLLCLSVLGGHFLTDLARTRPPLMTSAVIVHLALGTTSFIKEEAGRIGRLVHAIHGETEQLVASLPSRSLLLYESDCRERRVFGWLTRPFPLIVHDPDASIVSYSRPEPSDLDAFLAHFAGRSCFYVHRPDPRSPLEMMDCAAARPLLSRSLDEDTCPYFPSTAEALGLYHRF